MERPPGIEQIQGPMNPERQATPVTHRTPIVVLMVGRWQPAEVLAWWRLDSEWRALIRTRYTGYRDQEVWVRYDRARMLPVHIDEHDFDWWLPPARHPRDTPGPGRA